MISEKNYFLRMYGTDSTCPFILKITKKQFIQNVSKKAGSLARTQLFCDKLKFKQLIEHWNNSYLKYALGSNKKTLQLLEFGLLN